ncbi:MAG: OmpA family protein [Pyrinomonadaceae bacterium]|nr:OmpA family protein [Pyrinomonadaceae bacterium]
MNVLGSKKLKSASLTSALVLALGTAALAQTDANRSNTTTTNQSGTSTSDRSTSGTQQGTTSTSGTQQGTTSSSGSTTRTEATPGESSRTIASGEKVKIRGVVTRRDSETFTIQDENGVNTVVRLMDDTSVKTKGGFLRSGKNYGTTAILRGLGLEVEGRGDASGQLVANKVRFTDTELRVARSIGARVDPVESRVGTAENRIGQVEQNSQRLSGQLEELAAVSNAARGGAKAAQDTADSAIAGVNATNERISALDDYVPQQSVAVNFKVGSAVLQPEGKTQLDEIAKQAASAKGYVLEVGGFASADGSTEANRKLSQRRADSVIRYLVENHNIPLRRIITPYGYGEAQAVADNTTKEGRQQNRRVEVKVLVNRGIMQGSPNMTTPASTSSNPE